MKHTQGNYSLTFIRKATKRKDGWDGFIYLHHFGSGWQELIFSKKENAEYFAKCKNIPINKATL